MSDSNWERLQVALRDAQTPAEKRAAADALARYIPAEHQDKSMVTMQKGGVHVVKLGDLPDEMKNNPEVYERVRKIVGGKK
jgi:lipase chaperone LimK